MTSNGEGAEAGVPSARLSQAQLSTSSPVMAGNAGGSPKGARRPRSAAESPVREGLGVPINPSRESGADNGLPEPRPHAYPECDGPGEMEPWMDPDEDMETARYDHGG